MSVLFDRILMLPSLELPSGRNARREQAGMPALRFTRSQSGLHQDIELPRSWAMTAKTS